VRDASAKHEKDLLFSNAISAALALGGLMFAMRCLAVISVVLTMIPDLQGTLRAQPLRTTVEVDCGVFQKNSDGSWTLHDQTTVNEGIYGFVLKPGTFRRNDANVFGYDLTRVLEQDCLVGRQKR
jgi:hypothetical protein